MQTFLHTTSAPLTKKQMLAPGRPTATQLYDVKPAASLRVVWSFLNECVARHIRMGRAVRECGASALRVTVRSRVGCTQVPTQLELRTLIAADGAAAG